MTDARVPRILQGGTVLCIASGPSLRAEDVAFCRGKVNAAIAINTSYQLAPWADVLYACDAWWWGEHPEALAFPGLKYILYSANRKWPTGVSRLRETGEHGLELDPTGVRHGKNSGYQAVNVAVHLGATRILLLGYDMGLSPQGRSHWHDPHRNGALPDYACWAANFTTLVAPLQDLGIEVVNCSRRTALTAFPRVALEEALALAVPA